MYSLLKYYMSELKVYKLYEEGSKVNTKIFAGACIIIGALGFIGSIIVNCIDKYRISLSMQLVSITVLLSIILGLIRYFDKKVHKNYAKNNGLEEYGDLKQLQYQNHRHVVELQLKRLKLKMNELGLNKGTVITELEQYLGITPKIKIELVGLTGSLLIIFNEVVSYIYTLVINVNGLIYITMLLISFVAITYIIGLQSIKYFQRYVNSRVNYANKLLALLKQIH